MRPPYYWIDVGYPLESNQIICQPPSKPIAERSDGTHHTQRVIRTRPIQRISNPKKHLTLTQLLQKPLVSYLSQIRHRSQPTRDILKVTIHFRIPLIMLIKIKAADDFQARDISDQGFKPRSVPSETWCVCVG